MERLCCYLANHELFDSIDNNALNEEDTLTLIQLGDALKNEKNFSEEQVLAIESGLYDLQHRCGDEYYQKAMGAYNPAKEIEKALGNEKEAGKFTAQLIRGELHAADYVKNRLELLQNFIKSDEKTLDAFLSPAAPEKQQQKKIVDINAWTEEEADVALRTKAEEEAARNKASDSNALNDETPGRENAEEAAKKEAAEDVYGAAEAALTAAEELLQSRTELLSQQKRQQFFDKIKKRFADFAEDVNDSFEDREDYKNALTDNQKMLHYLEERARRHADSDIFGDDFRQKLRAFREKTNRLIVNPDEAAFTKLAVHMFDDKVQALEQETTKTEQKVREAVQALQDGLKNAKEQAEILKLQEALKAELGIYEKALSSAQEKCETAKDELEVNLRDRDYKNNVKNRFHLKQMENAKPLQENYQEMLDYTEQIKTAYNARADRNEIEMVFNGIRDTKPGRRTLGFRQKDDTLFKNMKTALADYIQNHDVESAGKAYEECRNYLASRMNPDKTLKKGNEHEKIRAQGVVRMLELMETLPEFQSFVEKKPAMQAEAKAEAPEGWEIMDHNVSAGYNKLNFEQLENSLAQHSSEKHSGRQYAGSAKNDKAFTNLNKRIGKKKAEEKAAQEKAAAKAAKKAKKAK